MLRVATGLECRTWQRAKYRNHRPGLSGLIPSHLALTTITSYYSHGLSGAVASVAGSAGYCARSISFLRARPSGAIKRRKLRMETLLIVSSGLRCERHCGIEREDEH